MKARRSVAIIVLAAFSQTACYSSYTITKSELEKLESSAEQKQTVTVYADCPAGTTASLSLHGTMWAQADPQPKPDEKPEEVNDEEALPSEIEDALPTEIENASESKVDAPNTVVESESGVVSEKAEIVPSGCTKVDVSTANSVQIVTKDGKKRVTPFNFIMNGGQIVSPEYNLLENLNDVDGAEVSQFSTWKTVGTIVVVSALAVGTFVGITIIAPGGDSFQN